MAMTRKRAELLVALEATLRKVGAQSVLLSDTVARLVGINSTDLECLDLLHLAGATTAGRLAAHSGLTTGAMTAVIDRLERAGFVRRLRDPQDRRVVLVEARQRGIDRIYPLYARLADANARLNARYTDKQLAVVVEYLTHATALATDHVTWLQTRRPMRREAPARSRPAARRGPAPRAGQVDTAV
jgi:DNA-binding MarR family transcriptional regulator